MSMVSLLLAYGHDERAIASCQIMISSERGDCGIINCCLIYVCMNVNAQFQGQPRGRRDPQHTVLQIACHYLSHAGCMHFLILQLAIQNLSLQSINRL